MKLRYLMAAGQWPSGNARYYLRRKGKPLVTMPDLPPEDPAFLVAYAAAMGMAKPPAPRPMTGTIGAGVEAFMRCDHYLAVSKGTRDIWRRHLDKISTSYGTARAAELAPEHIRADLDTLGLSQTDAAMMLGYGSQTRISEILAGKIQPNRSVILLLKAYIAGYRPEDWPQK